MANFVSASLCNVMNIKNTTTIATIVYLTLVILTFVTYWLGESGAKGLSISLGVFALALIKGTMISEHFMQLKFVSGFWRFPVLIWLVILAIVIFTAFNT